MNGLLQQVLDNFSFVIVCILVITALAVLAKFSEQYFPDKRSVSKARYVSIVGICAAIATVLHVLDFPLLFIAPEFYKLDFSELPVLLCGFYLGPTATVACEGVKILLTLVDKGTSTAFVGDFANFVVGCSFVLPATIVYHRVKSKKGALVGMAVGTGVMAVFGSLFNAVYLLPTFAELYGLPLETLIAMGTAVNKAINSVSTMVLFAVVPFNLVKGIIVTVLTFLLYKRVERLLKMR
jgi:riboflavin transporter FmnP